MSEAKVTILGCGSAKPTKTTSPSGQLVELCDKSFLVDCGEGVLLTMQRLGVHTGRLYNIFIYARSRCISTPIRIWRNCLRRC